LWLRVKVITPLLRADRWRDPDDTTLKVGVLSLRIRHVGTAHTAEHLVVYRPERGVLFAGDPFFRGRIPFVGKSDIRRWIAPVGGNVTVRKQAPTALAPGSVLFPRHPIMPRWLHPKFNRRPAAGQSSMAISRPLPDRVTKTVRMSAPPKHRLVV